MNTIQKAIEAFASINVPVSLDSIGFRMTGTRKYVFGYANTRPEKEFVSVDLVDGKTDGIAEALLEKAEAAIKKMDAGCRAAEAEFGAFFQAAA